MTERPGRGFRQFPVTALLLVALLLGAILTETTTRALTGAWLDRVGFAPRDFWNLELARMFTSALVTHGPRVLLGAILMTGFAVGLVERKTGWRAAVSVFWGVHLLTLVLLALVFSPLRASLQTRATETLLAVRDVGPSAGYFGCLGFGLAVSGWRGRTSLALAIVAWLSLAVVLPAGEEAIPQSFSADLAHLIAFPLGLFLGVRFPGRPAGRATAASRPRHSDGAFVRSGERAPVTGGEAVRILVIEDDVRLQRILQEGFADRDVEVAVAGTAREGREKAVLAHWDVIVLDIGLPDADGFETCARLRRSGVSTPILMLTARDQVADRVHGLETGADDYLVKPFDFRELAARVAALSRRPAAIAPESYTIADLDVDLRTRAISRAGQTIELTAKEFALLEFFVRNADAVVDRAAITAWVWDDNHDPFTNALEVLVRRLRAKIDDPFENKLIHTVRGAGYRFGP